MWRDKMLKKLLNSFRIQDLWNNIISIITRRKTMPQNKKKKSGFFGCLGCFGQILLMLLGLYILFNVIGYINALVGDLEEDTSVAVKDNNNKACKKFGNNQELLEYWESKNYGMFNDPLGLDSNNDGIPCNIPVDEYGKFLASQKTIHHERKQEKRETKYENKQSCERNIRGNISSSGEKIYHVPSGKFYDKTVPEETFCTEAEAKAAGYRKSKL
jgi:hypothetical protein